MFGGQGIFVDGLMIALISARRDLSQGGCRDDSGVRAAKGSRPFSYATKDGEHTLDSYWRMPDRLYDDPEELARWARAAHAAALRSSLRKRKPARRPRRK